MVSYSVIVGSALITALQPASIRLRIEESLNVIFGWVEERFDADFAEDVLVAPIGTCFLGFWSAEMKCVGSGHMEIENPRAASLWLRMVE